MISLALRREDLSQPDQKRRKCDLDNEVYHSRSLQHCGRSLRATAAMEVKQRSSICLRDWDRKWNENAKAAQDVSEELHLVHGDNVSAHFPDGTSGTTAYYRENDAVAVKTGTRTGIMTRVVHLFPPKVRDVDHFRPSTINQAPGQPLVVNSLVRSRLTLEGHGRLDLKWRSIPSGTGQPGVCPPNPQENSQSESQFVSKANMRAQFRTASASGSQSSLAMLCPAYCDYLPCFQCRGDAVTWFLKGEQVVDS
ncbi:hypothetical protein K438DRAFT_1772354 [Mycena galopus ATCC 62051]|nr:hypothetical protein K438DRAFT_1772354 [Mycena galopus ATCC 62051]